MAEKQDLSDLLTRGVEHIYPSKEVFEERLAETMTGEGLLSIYFGIDPTGPTLHLGHAAVLKKLRDLQRAGVKVTLLIGDFTARIGDPSGKDMTRKQLSQEDVAENERVYKEQASLFLSFEGDNPAVLRHNSEWLAGMSLTDILHLGSLVTVQQLLERDMFKRRMESENPIYVHEFIYPLMQGYDSVALETDAEIGGSDQTFNMLVGRTLERQILDKEKFVITLKLLEDAEGVKMGKTEGNMVTFNDSAQDMVGKIMSWSDEMVVPAFELCTDVASEEIEAIQEGIINGEENPRDAKLRLAREITTLFHGEGAAQKASDAFQETFTGGGVPEDVPEVVIVAGDPVVDTLVEHGVVASRSEFRRLVNDGAVRDTQTGERITDPSAVWRESTVLKIGKHRFFKGVIE